MDSDSCRQNNDLLQQFLSEMEAEDVLTPISMVQLINIDDTYENIIKTIAQNPHTCYPVYKDGVDNILGILYMSDLLLFDPNKSDINSILQYPLFISENKGVLDLLQEFKQKHTSFAIVVDEYGSVRGVVTQTGILESLLDDEESEETLKELIIDMGSEFLIDPKLSLEEFNKKFSKELIGMDCDSLGGYVIEKFTYVPEWGEELKEDGMTITVSQTEGAKLLALTVKFD